MGSCRVIELPRIGCSRGNITFIESSNEVPFNIQRVFYLYDIPEGCSRGSHAHRDTHQFIIATSGSFDVELDNGHDRKSYHLNRSYYGLYVYPMTWVHLKNFSKGAVCTVLASDFYKEDDYIRNYDTFIAETGGRNEDSLF